MIHQIFFFISGNLQQCVSDTRDGKRCTSIMVSWFPWFKNYSYLLLGKSKVYCQCYSTQWHTGLATTNREWIWDDSHNTWNFLTSQAVIVQTRTFPLWELKWTLSTFFNPQKKANRKPHFKRHKTFVLIILQCTFKFRRTGCAFFIHSVFLIYMTKRLSGWLIQLITHCPDFQQYYQSSLSCLT